MDASKKNILLVGPTASGKSAIAHQLALKLGFPIISADSRQVYKLTDIGTAKPINDHLKEVEYYNISILDIKDQDNAESFHKRCQFWLDSFKTPAIFVGGSTLYQQGLLFGFDNLPEAKQENIEKMKQEMSQFGIEYLFKKLQRIDPVYSQKMDGYNTQRIFRALDVYDQTGKPFSSFHSKQIKKPENWFVVYPIVQREKLKERIQSRIHAMIQNGLLNEVVQILSNGYTFSDPGLKSIGYQEWKDFLEENKNLDETIQQIYINTWHYAKRQITWLKRWDFLKPYFLDELSLPIVVDKIITDYSAFLKE